jgi:hypothetical protein
MTEFSENLLRPDNHDLYTHVRLMAIARDPVLSWEEIAVEVGLDEADVPALLAWFLSYRLPPPPRVRLMPEGMALPRDPVDRAEYLRLQEREASLITVVSEAPAQLAAVQMKMGTLEKRKYRKGSVW